MKEIQLVNCKTYELDFQGRKWHFMQGRYKKVPDSLADRLLSTGDFMDIVRDDAFILTPKSPVVGSIVPPSQAPKKYQWGGLVPEIPTLPQVPKKRRGRKKKKVIDVSS